MVLNLGGEVTVRNVRDVHVHLCDILRHNDAVALGVAQLEDCDLTIVQLIESARRSASRDGKTLTLADAPSGALLNVLERAGMVGTGSSDNFWLQALGAR